jgi:hypothetical protein
MSRLTAIISAVVILLLCLFLMAFWLEFSR